MIRALRTVFCIFACICVAASIPAGVFLGWSYFAVVLAAAVLFGALMVAVKNLDDKKHPERKPDFMNPPEEKEAPPATPRSDGNGPEEK